MLHVVLSEIGILKEVAIFIDIFLDIVLFPGNSQENFPSELLTVYGNAFVENGDFTTSAIHSLVKIMIICLLLTSRLGNYISSNILFFQLSILVNHYSITYEMCSF